MPDWDSIFKVRGLQELNQYPDPLLYEAAKRLRPEDRPNAPVRWLEPDPAINPIFRVAPNTQGIADHRTRSIFLARRKEKELQDPNWLAGVMGHEAEHIRRGDYEEGPAYAKQLNILGGLGYKGPNKKALMKMASIKK